MQPRKQPDNPYLFQQGKAQILTKYITKGADNKLIQNQVFYNPIQVFNRDVSILVMQHYIDQLREQNKKEDFEGVRIVDALSASGLRTIRFLKELDGVKQIYANDISESSHKLMADNFKLNNLDQSKIVMTLQDANVLINESKLKFPFDIIDLDPYGSVVPFLQSSLGSIKDGGLLCATCTDTRVTCGPDFHKCFYYYGTTRTRVQCFQENALRVVLNTINTVANKHCRYIEPIHSFQTQFYLRVFVRVHRNKTECANSGLKVGTVYNCDACGNYEYQTLFTQKEGKNRARPAKLQVSGPLCTVCNDPYYLNTPIWLAPINNFIFIEKMLKSLTKSESTEKKPFLQLKSQKRIYGMLHALLHQKKLSEIPLGFNLQIMSKNIKAITPPKKVMFAALQSLGFRMVGSYIHDGLYKTDATAAVIYDVLKSWKINKSGEQNLKLNVKQFFALKILDKPITHVPDFEHQLKEVIEYVPQFFPHEEKGMGPKGKALKRVLEEQEDALERIKEQILKRRKSSTQGDKKG